MTCGFCGCFPNFVLVRKTRSEETTHKLTIRQRFVTDEKQIIDQSIFDQENNIKVSHGKKQHVIVKII
mgnify:CR=1 FL=1